MQGRSIIGALRRSWQLPRLFASSANAEPRAAAASSSGQTLLTERGPFAARLGSRGVVGLDGDDVFKFLQGLSTNDVMQLNSEGHAAMLPHPTPNQPAVVQPPVYSDILNPQGRFMFDMFLYKPVQPAEKLNGAGDGPGAESNYPKLIADVDAASLDELLAYLRKHVLRSKVSFENLSGGLHVWQRFGGSLADAASPEDGASNIGWGGGRDAAGTTSAVSNENGWRWYRDPRLEALGFRGIFPSNVTPPLVEAAQQVDERYYVLWRLEQGVPEGNAEIPGEAIPLEYNMARLNAISFDKGCYVGQELIARTHHRGVIRKRLMPVHFVDESGEEAQAAVGAGAEIVDEAGKKVGKVTTALGPRGFALLKLDAACKVLRVRDSEGVCVKAIRPKWWPSEWGKESATE